MTENIQPVPEIELTDIDWQNIQETAERIDLTDSALILYYGTAEQQKLASVSDKLFRLVRDDGSAEISGQMENMIKQIRVFSDWKEKRGLFGWLLCNRTIKNLRKRYVEAEKNILPIAANLERHRNQLLRDFVMLDKLYDALLERTTALTVAVEAGQCKLNTDTEAEKELKERFEKRLHDLQLSRMVCLQMLTQIRILQGCNTALAEKIQSLLTNTVLLWKNQMAASLAMKNQTQAFDGLREANRELIGLLDDVRSAGENSSREACIMEKWIGSVEKADLAEAGKENTYA